MMNQILSRDNLIQAIKRVERNKGSHGVDDMPVQNLRSHIMKHWETIRQHLEEGTYKPSPVRRVEIPKLDGGVRLLGIPTVIDRFIQQAIAQVLTRVFDPHFSKYSFGFRPNKQAHQAIRQAKHYIKEGYRWVIDMDLEKFFDKVNHDKLMGILAKKIKDKTLLKLIYQYLQSGVMENGVSVRTEVGTPQGGPLSPLLANILLDELDKELEHRGHRFVRYADDFHIYVKSKKAGERVKDSITGFIEKKLKLKVNREKSAVDRPWKRKFLGFSFTPHNIPKVRVHHRSLMKLKEKIRTLTSRSKGWSMEHRINHLNRYLMGWCGYYALADTKSIFQRLDGWIRRRLRMCLWKDWKIPKARKRNLIRLGVPRRKAHEWANSRKGYWRVTKSPILERTLNNSFWNHLGLLSLYQRYSTIRQS
jgi:RNA-directed DNA polymerase